MRKLLARLQHRLEAFSEQRDLFTLVLRCEDVECAHILKTLQAIDEGGSPDLYWSFAEPFTNPQDYVDAVVAQFVAQHEGVNQLLEEAGEAPWPPVPDRVRDETASPAERLRQAMIFSRTLLPSLDGHVGVWAFCPVQIEDARDYARLMQALALHRLPVPWCHHLRLIVRDMKTRPALTQLPQQVPRVQVHELDLSPEAIEQSFEEEAADEHEPLPMRMQALLVLAGMDFSHRRYDQALEKYDLLNRYYRTVENDEMTALTWNGMGEVYRGLDRDDEAQRHFELALTPAIEAESPPVLLNVTLNLANLHLEHERWEEAASYYDSAEKLASAQLNATTKIQSLENRGYCEYRLGKPEDAVQTWNEAAEVARGVDEPELLKPVLQRLHDVFQQHHMPQQQHEVKRELAALA